MAWLQGVREREKSGMTWRVELSFTNVGDPVGASALGGNIRNLSRGDVKCEMSIRHLGVMSSRQLKIRGLSSGKRFGLL